MTTDFDVQFVGAGMPGNERDAGLEGSGSLRVTPDGLTVSTTQRRATLAAALATLVAIVTMLVALVATVMLLDAMGANGQRWSTKLGVAVGLLTLVGSGLGSFAVLERVLPRRRVVVLVPWPYVVTTRAVGARVQIVSAAPALSGTWTMETPRVSALRAAIESAASSGRA